MLARPRSGWTWAAWAVALASFCIFAHYRVRYIGGCDSSAYLIESWRLRGLDVGLGRDPSVPQQAALVPLCMVEHAGVVRSFFPPGFSLLLAGAGLLGLEHQLMAFVGALSGLALFLLARPLSGAPIALATMIAWLATPMTLWGSTQVMSDLPAATCLLWALVAAERGKPSAAGLLLGLALGVRPTTALFLPALLLLVASPAAMTRVVLGLGVACVGWLAFALASFGSLHVPYAGNLVELTGENFAHQAGLLLGETARQHAPVVALALVACVRAPRASIPYVAWLAPFVVVHALWRVPYDAWWHLRFVLPGLPAVFLLAARGAAYVRDGLPDARALRSALGTLALAGYLVFCTAFPPAKIHRTTDWDARYARDARRIAARLPQGALVGATNDSAPLRYYARMQSFFLCHAQAPALIRWALDVGRPVYAIFDGPAEQCGGLYASLWPALVLTPVDALPSGRRLVRLALTSSGRH